MFISLVTLASSLVSAASDEPTALLRRIDAGFVQLFEKVAPAVVVIEASKREAANALTEADPLLPEDEEAPRNRERAPRSSTHQSLSEGSGFFVRTDGHILTNLHVVEGAERLDVRLKDGRRFTARLVGADDRTDIAVLKIESSDLAVAPFGDSDALRIGQLVCAIGAPFHQDYSFTCGWVSGKGRTNLLRPTPPRLVYEDYIQTDAFINPGNSGGPLFDVEGHVIGMNTLINGLARGLAFAIPSNMLRDISEQLIAHGKVQRPWLGIRMVGVSENGGFAELAVGAAKGVVISTIEANSPAYASDLRAVDVITAIDGKELSSPRDLQREILRRKVGAVVQLTVRRAGQLLQVPITTGQLPEDAAKVLSLDDSDAPPNVEVLGLVLRDTPAGPPRIIEIAPDSPAAHAELAPGDVITAVEGEPQTSAENATAALEAAASKNAKKGVLVNIERAGKKSWIVIERASR